MIYKLIDGSGSEIDIDSISQFISFVDSGMINDSTMLFIITDNKWVRASECDDYVELRERLNKNRSSNTNIENIDTNTKDIPNLQHRPPSPLKPLMDQVKEIRRQAANENISGNEIKPTSCEEKAIDDPDIKTTSASHNQQLLYCKHCRNDFEIPKSELMSLHIRCPKCDRRYENIFMTKIIPYYGIISFSALLLSSMIYILAKRFKGLELSDAIANGLGTFIGTLVVYSFILIPISLFISFKVKSHYNKIVKGADWICFSCLILMASLCTNMGEYLETVKAKKRDQEIITKGSDAILNFAKDEKSLSLNESKQYSNTGITDIDKIFNSIPRLMVPYQKKIIDLSTIIASKEFRDCINPDTLISEEKRTQTILLTNKIMDLMNDMESAYNNYLKDAYAFFNTITNIKYKDEVLAGFENSRKHQCLWLLIL